MESRSRGVLDTRFRGYDDLLLSRAVRGLRSPPRYSAVFFRSSGRGIETML
jgi:hypothetical protein